MNALAIVAIIVGLLPILAGAIYMFLDDPWAFLFAIGTTAIVGGGIALASWGIAGIAKADFSMHTPHHLGCVAGQSIAGAQ
jgi:hypothetical protein